METKASKVYSKQVAGSRVGSAVGMLFGHGKRRVITILIIVLVAAGITGGLYYNNQKQKQTNEKKAYEQMVQTFTTLRMRNQYQLATTTLKKYLATNPKNHQYRYEAKTYLAGSYRSINQPKEAVVWFKSALEETGTANDGLYSALADVCRQIGDTQCALTNYRKAVELLKQDKSPELGVGPRIMNLESQISELEAKK
jgi:tetratricopeptide (TPR) repeat protein